MILANEFKKTATLRQKILLHRLKRYANKEKDLQSAITFFIDNEGDAVNSFAGDGGSILFNLNSSSFKRQLPPSLDACYKELEELETKIGKTLEKAVKMGMEEVEPVKLNLPYYVEKEA